MSQTYPDGTPRSAWWRVLCFVLSISWWIVSQNARYCPSALSPTSPSTAKMMSPSPNRKLWFSSWSYTHYPGSLFFLPSHYLCSSTQCSSFSTLPWMKARLYLTGPLWERHAHVGSLDKRHLVLDLWLGYKHWERCQILLRYSLFCPLQILCLIIKSPLQLGLRTGTINCTPGWQEGDLFLMWSWPPYTGLWLSVTHMPIPPSPYSFRPCLWK